MRELESSGVEGCIKKDQVKQYKRSKIYTSREGNPEHRIKERETYKTDVR